MNVVDKNDMLKRANKFIGPRSTVSEMNKKKKRKKLPGTSLVEMGIKAGVNTVRSMRNSANRASSGKAPGSINTKGLLKDVRSYKKRLKDSVNY